VYPRVLCRREAAAVRRLGIDPHAQVRAGERPQAARAASGRPGIRIGARASRGKGCDPDRARSPCSRKEASQERATRLKRFKLKRSYDWVRMRTTAARVRTSRNRSLLGTRPLPRRVYDTGDANQVCSNWPARVRRGLRRLGDILTLVVRPPISVLTGPDPLRHGIHERSHFSDAAIGSECHRRSWIWSRCLGGRLHRSEASPLYPPEHSLI